MVLWSSNTIPSDTSTLLPNFSALREGHFTMGASAHTLGKRVGTFLAAQVRYFQFQVARPRKSADR